MSIKHLLPTLFIIVALFAITLIPASAQSEVLPMPYSGATPGIIQRAPFEIPAHLIPTGRSPLALTLTRFDDPAVVSCDTSDGVSLREAIFYCATGSVQPTIYLPAGTYTLNSQIVTSALSFVLIGESPLNTFIQPAAGIRPFDFGLATALPPTTITISNLTIQNSTSGASGNALRVVGGGIFNLDNVRVQNNNGSVRGTVRFDVENNARMTITINNTTITGNTASAGAGLAITNELGNGTVTLAITNSDISNNTASGNGGGILVNSTSALFTGLTVSNTLIHNNDAANGAGIAVINDTNTPTNVSLFSTTITENTATTSGGGLLFNSGRGELLIENSTIGSNTVTAGNGGGLLAEAGRQLMFKGVNFLNNTAPTGVSGAMQFNTDVAAVTLNDTLVRGNSANSVGGIYAFLVDSVTANRLTVTGNSATLEVGGALFAPSNFASLNDSAFTLNTAGGEMGGLYTARTVLRNVSIEDNSAPIAPDCKFNALSGESYSLGGVFITNMAGCAGDFTPAAGDLIDNLLVNGGFEFAGSTAKLPANWTPSKLTGDSRACNSVKATLTPYGNCLMQFKGGTGEAASLKQDIDLTDLTFTAGDELRVTAFGDGANAKSRLRIRITATYSDQPKNQSTITFTGNHTGLTRSTQLLTLSSGNVSKITIQITHLSTGGKFLLDRVYLTR